MFLIYSGGDQMNKKILIALYMITLILLTNFAYSPQKSLKDNLQNPVNHFINENPNKSGLEKKIRALAGSSSWAFTYLEYRIQVTISTSIDLYDYPVDIYIDFESYGYHPKKNSIRVADSEGNEIPSQVWNVTPYGTDRVSSATITFLVNASAGTSLTYYIYFDEDYNTSPNYEKQVVYWAVPGGRLGDYYFNGTNYKYARTNYYSGGKLWDVYHYPGDYISDLPSTYGWHNGYGESHPSDPRYCWNWNPDLAYSPSTSNQYHVPGYIEEAGPLFVTYITPKMTMGDHGNVSTRYRFFKWGFIVETNITWFSSYSHDFRMNEWVFERMAFTHLFYGSDPSDPTIVLLSDTDYNSPNLDESQVSYLGFINIQYGYSAGTILIKTLKKGVTYQSGYYQLFRRTASYDFWHRYIDNAQWTANSWIYEKYVILIWDARASNARDALTWFLNRVSQFLVPPSINVASSVEIYKVSIPIKVVDRDAEPIEGAIVEIINNTDESVVDRQYTNSSGIAILKARPYGIAYDLNITVVSHNKKYNKYEPYEILVTGTSPILDLRTYQFNIQKVLIKVYDGVRITHVYNATIRLTNSTNPSDYIEGVTDNNGWISFYIKNGTWDLTVYYADTQRTISVYNATSEIGFNETTEKILADHVTSYQHDHERNIDFVIEIEDLSLPPPAFFSIVNGSTYYEVEWGKIVYLEILLHDKNMTPIDVNSLTDAYVRWCVLDMHGNEVPPYLTSDMDEVELGHYALTIDTSKLPAGAVYTIYVEANLTTYYISPNPLSISLKVNPVRTNLEIMSLPSTLYYSERLFISVSYKDIYGNSLSDAIVNVTIGGKVYDLTYDSRSDSFILDIDHFTDIEPGIYTVEINAYKGNYTAQSKSRVIFVDNRLSDLIVMYDGTEVSSLRIYHTDKIIIFALYKDALNDSIIKFAEGEVKLIKYISGQEFVTLKTINFQWNNTANAYQTIIDLSDIGTGVYELQISFQKEYYYYQSKTMSFIIEPIKASVIVSEDYTEIY